MSAYRERIEFARARLDPTSGDQAELRILREEVETLRVALEVSEEQRAERERVLGAEIEHLLARVPNPDDLRNLLAKVDWMLDFEDDPEAVEMAARVRATLEGTE